VKGHSNHRFVYALIGIAFLGVMASAQQKKFFWDGYDWLNIDRITTDQPGLTFWVKSAYLSGLLDAKLYYRLKAANLPDSLRQSVFEDELKPGGLRRYTEGLDEFYRDISQRYVPLPCALIAVIMIQHHQSPELIRQFIRTSQEWINDLMIQYD